MGLFTTNNINIYLNTPPAQPEPAHRPPDNNGNKDALLEIAIAVGVSCYVDPYMTTARGLGTQILEVLGCPPGIASTVSALVCFTVVCAAPTLIRRILGKVVN